MSEKKYIWRFNINRRVYSENGRKFSGSGPIWREHWEKFEVIGETTRSWLCGHKFNPIKVSKKGPWMGIAFSEEEVDGLSWVNDHAYRISEEVRRLPLEKLRAVAELIDYPTK